MIRSFNTHQIRRQTELTGLWHFTPLSGDHQDEERMVAVPSCWESYPGLSAYRGEAVYQTSFPAAGNVRLVFKGVSHTAQVSFDGREAARHYNAYTPFSAVIPAVPAGSHTLAVRVDNAFGPGSALHIPNDYMTYGGITRPVALEIVADTYLETVHARPFRRDSAWFLELTVTVRNIGAAAHQAAPAATLAGNSCLFAPQQIAAGEQAVFQAEMACRDVETYELEHPALYLLQTEICCDNSDTPCDDLIERVGFRDIRLSGRNILFNGKALRIKGFCRHEDHPQFGCALPYAALDYDLNLLLDLGANAVRTSHYPNDELFLDLCDEKGLLVWEENHARGLTEEMMRNPNFDRQCDDCIREMIASHYNHPAIFIWGILNECASDTPYGRECYARQLARIRELDQSRPVSFASNKYRADLCLDLADVISFNTYPGWYSDEPVRSCLEGLDQWAKETAPGSGKPLIISEIGAGGIYGYRTPTHVKWSEERQADLLEAQIRQILSMEDITGVFIWQFCDIRISEEWFRQRPRTMNNKGIVDEYRRPKLVYPVVRAIFRAQGNYRTASK